MFGRSGIGVPALVLGLVSGLAGPLLGASLPTVREIQRGFERANGGFTNLQNLTSVVASGISRLPDGREMPTNLYVKRPGLLRLLVETEGGQVTAILNEEGVYRFFESRSGEVREMAVAREEFAQLQNEAVIGGPLSLLLDEVDAMSVEGALLIDGIPVYEIAVDANPDVTYERLWVHQQEFYVVKLLSRIPTEDGGVIEEVTRFSNYEKVEGVWMAKEIEYIQDGELVQWLLLDSIRGNVGLFDSFFRRPR